MHLYEMWWHLMISHHISHVQKLASVSSLQLVIIVIEKTTEFEILVFVTHEVQEDENAAVNACNSIAFFILGQNLAYQS